LIQLIELEMFASLRGRTLLASQRAPRLLLMMMMMMMMMMGWQRGLSTARGKLQKKVYCHFGGIWLQLAKLLVPMAPHE